MHCRGFFICCIYIYSHMQQRVVINKGKRYLVNVATADDGAVGAGFAVGQLTLKSYTDLYWYVVMAQGTAGSVTTYVSQSQLTTFGTSSYYDLNFPYQLLQAVSQSYSSSISASVSQSFTSSYTHSYYVYLTGTAPSASIVVSQSAYTGSSQPKPYLLLQNITDMNYYYAYLTYTGGTVSLTVNQTMVSQSWVNPIY